MGQNSLNHIPNANYPQGTNLSPNAVNINIYSPQAFSTPQGVQNPINPAINSLYQPNVSNMPLYPYNYNNMSVVPPYQTNPLNNNLNAYGKPLDAVKNNTQMSADKENNTQEEIEETQEEQKNQQQNEEKKEEQITVEQAQTGLPTQILESNVPSKFTNEYNGVKVKNETNYQLTEEMLTPNISINNKNVLIFHTHTCESYTPSENFQYQQTGTYRTTDYNYNVVRVGTELTNQLESYGYNVIHDNTYHDYPAYSGSYDRSLTTVENLLKEHTDTDVVIDLHRDAIGDYSYAPTVQIGEEQAAQMMFVIGTDGGGLTHPNWNSNLKFAMKIQQTANELYPGLFKPLVLRNSRYNQHLTKAACIIEVGATGNTMEQCLNSMKYLAKVMDEVLKNS